MREEREYTHTLYVCGVQVSACPGAWYPGVSCPGARVSASPGAWYPGVLVSRCGGVLVALMLEY